MPRKAKMCKKKAYSIRVRITSIGTACVVATSSEEAMEKCRHNDYEDVYHEEQIDIEPEAVIDVEDI